MLPVPVMVRVCIMGMLTLGALPMSACQTTAAEPSPAVITKATPATLSKLSNAVGSVLGSHDIRLTSEQIEGRTSIAVRPLNLAKRGGLLIDGRSNARPEYFDIMKSGSRAYLVHRETGTEIDIKGIDLKPTS